MLNKNKDLLSEIVYKRARHIVKENQRVLDSLKALKDKNVDKFGELMNQSHESLKNDYEVSCRELDIMVKEARKIKGTIGSRMTGAGFGGCTVSIVKDDSLDEFQQAVGTNYEKAIGLKPDFFIVNAVDGVEIQMV